MAIGRHRIAIATQFTRPFGCPDQFLARCPRDSVLDCGSPLPLLPEVYDAEVWFSLVLSSTRAVKAPEDWRSPRPGGIVASGKFLCQCARHGNSGTRSRTGRKSIRRKPTGKDYTVRPSAGTRR